MTETPNIAAGYIPGLLGRVTQLHASYYSREHAFGCEFECKVASDMAEFLGRIDTPVNETFHAQVSGQIIGSVSIDGEDLGGKAAHLRWFIVDGALAGRGLGRSLLKRAIDHVDRQNFSETHLWTFKGLDTARYLYEKFGFQLVEERSGDQWGTTVIEQKFVRQHPALCN